jgi:hypothetical protein
VIESDANPDSGEDAADKGDAARLVPPRIVRFAVTISHARTSQSVCPTEPFQDDGAAATATVTLPAKAIEWALDT